MIKITENGLFRRVDKEVLLIQPWGENSFRIRATQNRAFDEDIPSALTETLNEVGMKAEITLEKEGKAAVIRNGKLTCYLSETGKLKLNKIAARWPVKAVAQFSTLSKKGS